MAIAFIPLKHKDLSQREEWLSMTEADKLICDYFGAKVSKNTFYKDWFNNFYYFDFMHLKDAKNLTPNEQYYEFYTAPQAVEYYHEELFKDLPEEYHEIHKQGEHIIFEIINLLYNSGYKIISLNA